MNISSLYEEVSLLAFAEVPEQVAQLPGGPGMACISREKSLKDFYVQQRIREMKRTRPGTFHATDNDFS